MAYKGISKKDIMQMPTKDVFSKIQSNHEQSQKFVNQMRLDKLKNRMEVETNYSKIKTQFEQAKKVYLRNKDSKSLENY